MTPAEPPKGELILYQTDDAWTRVECRFEGDTIWLTQAQLAELFETSVPNINIHLEAIYEEGELDEGATIRPYLMVRADGARSVSRLVLHYALPAILAVGFRVRSHRGTQFRRWAIKLVEELVAKEALPRLNREAGTLALLRAPLRPRVRSGELSVTAAERAIEDVA